MSTTLIFIMGVFVTLIVGVATALIGLSEAADPAHSKPGDLANWEQSLVGDARKSPDAKDA